MRAVKAIIISAGNEKKKNPDKSENELCEKAIRDCNIPKFVSKDVPLFENILFDLFQQNMDKEPNPLIEFIDE